VRNRSHCVLSFPNFRSKLPRVETVRTIVSCDDTACTARFVKSKEAIIADLESINLFAFPPEKQRCFALSFLGNAPNWLVPEIVLYYQPARFPVSEPLRHRSSTFDCTRSF
jgi:hypothetical protein